MFHLGADARLGLLQLVQDGTHGRVLLQGPALARPHGNVPVHVRVPDLNFFALFNAPVARVGKHFCFLTVQQFAGLPSSTVGCKLLIQKKKKLPLQMTHLNEIKHLQRLVSNSGAPRIHETSGCHRAPFPWPDPTG